MLAEAQTETATEFGPNTVEIRPYRSKFYISIKSSAIQRWAAKTTVEYYTLTTGLWRGSFAKPNRTIPAAAGSQILTGMRQTLYFDHEEDAISAARDFLTRLVEKGVKI